ncbi:MAG: hypothetical protein RSC92_00840 [Clostridia bacterium]
MEKDVVFSREDITNMYEKDVNMYINDNLKNKNIIDEKEKITEDVNGITYNKIFVINEDVGEFKPK